MTLKLQRILQSLLEEMKMSTPDTVCEVVWRIKENFCIHCGRQHGPDSYCQCWNDE